MVLEIERLRQAVRQTRAELPFGIRAWVVLPDHLHCIWDMPLGDADFVSRWRRIMRRFATALPKGPRRLAQISGGERGIWARDFHAERIASDAALTQRLVGLAADPARHGLVERAADWPFSSFAQRFVREDA
ncbi:MAG: REP-associated tyrosine transposase [Cypionkella sp.]